MLPLKLSLGPVQYYWRRNDIHEFYARMLETPVHTLFLGEVVCGKRHELRSRDWIALARDLAGNTDKHIVLSTLTLLESGADLNSVRTLCDNGDLLVEANDMAAVQLLASARLPFAAGPAINIYNTAALNYLQTLGMVRWCAPVELGQAQLVQILDGTASGIEVEIFAWGRQPLAYSARCFTARHYGLNKDDCQFRCAEHPAGLPLETQEQQGLFTLNGIATMAHLPTNLIGHLPAIAQAGIDHLRISPEWGQTEYILSQFARALAGEPAQAATGTDGYWRQQEGLALIASDRD